MSGEPFPSKKLGEVLRHARRPVTPLADRRYDLIGVRWYAAGTHLHDTIEGAKLQAPTLWEAREGDIIYNKMWTSKGAFAVVSKETGGLFGTSEYPTFETKPNVSPDFLRCAFQQARFWQLAEAMTNGTTERARLSPRDFLRLSLSLPALAEQSAIANVLDVLESTIAKTEALIAQVSSLSNAISSAPLGRNTRTKATKLKSIIKSLDAGVSVSGELRPRGTKEFGVLRTSCVSSGIFFPDQHKVIRGTDLNRAAVNPRADCIIINRANSPELVGASAYVQIDHNDLFLSDKLWLLDVKNRDEVNVRWLSLVLGASRTRKRLSIRANGTSGSMFNISKSALLNLEIDIPPIGVQMSVAALADALERRQLSERSYLVELLAVRAALAQELLSGRLRLPESIIALHRDKPGQAA
jgi:type I restriction enzyme S subunit